ncbi:odorant receptor 4-like [Rhodnius prolixus]
MGNSSNKKGVRGFKIRKNVQYSGYQLARWCGFFYDKSWTTFWNITRALILVITSVIHKFLAILLSKDLDILEKVLLVNYTTLGSSCALMALSLIYKSKKMSLFLSVIKSEFYQPEIKLSRKQQAIKKKTNTFLRLFINNIAIYYHFSMVINFFRRPLMEGLDLKILPLPGWLPFEMNSWFRYIAVSTFQFMSGFSLVNTHVGMILTFVIHSKLLCDEFEILSIYVEETFERNFGELMELSETNEKRQEFINRRLTYIIRQHGKLLSYFELFQEIYSMFLFLFSACAGALLCTVVYIITDPNSKNMTIIISAGCVLLTEAVFVGIYCWFGQEITNKIANVREAVYFIPWYEESVSTQKSLLNVLTACNRDRIVKGGGLQEFSMKGLCELYQASFSYFNMLNAMR